MSTGLYAIFVTIVNGELDNNTAGNLVYFAMQSIIWLWSLAWSASCGQSLRDEALDAQGVLEMKQYELASATNESSCDRVVEVKMAFLIKEMERIQYIDL